MNLLVYGTLLFPEIRNLVGGRVFESRPVTIHGYRIYRVQDADYPGVVKTSPNDKVPGEILLDISKEELSRFDDYEDGFYVRCQAEVELDGSQIKGELYEVPPGRADAFLSQYSWTKEWFARHHFDPYLKRLKNYF